MLHIHPVPSFCGISVLHVICVPRIDFSMMLCAPLVLSFYAVGLAECVTSYYKAVHEYITSDVLQQMYFNGWMTKWKTLKYFNLNHLS